MGLSLNEDGIQPASLLKTHVELIERKAPPGPVLDLACGEGHNGIFLATKGFEVILCDRNGEALERAAALAESATVNAKPWLVDLEREGAIPLSEDAYAAILVFRYLHRPLIPCIRKALKKGGYLFYETFTIGQSRFGRPHNPDFLLKPGELKGWFEDWEIIHQFEGVKKNPERAVAQIVCRKPEHKLSNL